MFTPFVAKVDISDIDLESHPPQNKISYLISHDLKESEVLILKVTRSECETYMKLNRFVKGNA